MKPGTNLVLIGMPGSGKSTVGVLLAKHLGMGFVDTDILIQEHTGRRLQEVVDEHGYRELRRLEEEAILALAAAGAVVATGGSAVYSRRAMEHLRRNAVLVYLKAPPELLEARMSDFDRRGIANPPGQSLRQIWEERAPLYERYADLTVEVGAMDHESVARAVMALVP